MTANSETKLRTPRAEDWNNFWSLDRTRQFTKVSWSKRRLVTLLRPYALAGRRALDAGCGSGFFSKFFCDQGMAVTALDYAREALDIAGRMTEGRAALVQEDLLKPGLAGRMPARYDVIFTDGLFEHFSQGDQDAILSNLAGVLNENGVIVTVVPNKFSPWELIRPFYMPGIDEKPFTMDRLIDLHKRAGLKLLAAGGLNTFPFRFSPDSLAGPVFGMLLYNIARK